MAPVLAALSLVPLSVCALFGCSEERPPSTEPRSHALCETLSQRPECAPDGFSGCSDAATPDSTHRLSEVSFFLAEPPYDNAACAGRYVYEVDIDDEELEPSLALGTVWDISIVDTPEKCADILVDVAVERALTPGTWEPWDAYRIVGHWTAELGACETVFCGGGKLSSSERNDVVGGPWSWVDVAGVERVRVAVAAHDAACTQQKLMLQAINQ